jgi:hypothetical protein
MPKIPWSSYGKSREELIAAAEARQQLAAEKADRIERYGMTVGERLEGIHAKEDSTTSPTTSKSSPLYYADTGEPFKGPDNVLFVSATDMRMNPERYMGIEARPYIIDLSDAGSPGEYLYNEGMGRSARLTANVLGRQGLRSAKQAVKGR